MRFPGSVGKDIDRWTAKGLIDQPTAAALKAELAEKDGFGLGGILAVFGALLLGAALVTLVASNWDAIPRVARVAAIIAMIWLCWLAGAWRDSRSDGIFSQIFYLVGAMAFGAGIALVGQMYHLSGDSASAALVWAAGTLLGAFLLRAPILGPAAAGICLAYIAAAVSENSWHQTWFILIAPLLALVIGGLSLANGSQKGLHGSLWVLLATVITHRFSSFSETMNQLDTVFAFGGAALFFMFAYFEAAIDRMTGFAHALLGYALALSFFGFAVLQSLYGYDHASTAMLGLLVIGLAVAALLLKGRDHGSVRALSYAAFGAEILYLASVTIGSLLDTSVFFLFSGVIVMVIARLVIRIEKRIKVQPGAAI